MAEEIKDTTQVEEAKAVYDEPQLKSGSILGLTEQHEVIFFKTSELPKPQAISDFLKKLHTKNAFNKYCIDCKKNATTHALIWLGTFVCETCAKMHLDHLPNGCQSKTYVKKIADEHWDDYHLRSVQLGGNKPLFDILKEYEIQDLDFQKRYKHPALNWYKRRHAAKMDSKEFQVPQPPKNWDERVDMTKSTLKKTGNLIGQKSEVWVGVVGRGTVKAGVAIGQGAKSLKEKNQDKPWAKKITGLFSKVSSTNNRRASMSEEGVRTESMSSGGEVEEEQKKDASTEEKPVIISDEK